MLGIILPKLIILSFLYYIFVNGNYDFLQLYQPSPELPQELNDFLSVVQEHKNDFAVIRSYARKHTKAKNLQEAETAFSLHKDMLGTDEAQQNERRRRSLIHNNNHQLLSHITPHKYSKRHSTNQKHSIKSPLRLRRDLDLTEDIRIAPNSEFGEIKRSGDKYPGRDIHEDDNVDELKRAPRTKSKRQIEIDVKSDGMLVKRIKEDARDPKSIVLNIESSANRNPLIDTSKLKSRNSVVNLPALTLQKKSSNGNILDQMKSNEFASNYINLVSANENLNTDRSILLDNLELTTEDPQKFKVNTNFYVIEKDNFNRNYAKLQADAAANRLLASKMKINTIQEQNNIMNKQSQPIKTNADKSQNQIQKYADSSEFEPAQSIVLDDNNEQSINNEPKQHNVGYDKPKYLNVRSDEYLDGDYEEFANDPRPSSVLLAEPVKITSSNAPIVGVGRIFLTQDMMLVPISAAPNAIVSPVVTTQHATIKEEIEGKQDIDNSNSKEEAISETVDDVSDASNNKYEDLSSQTEENTDLAAINVADKQPQLKKTKNFIPIMKYENTFAQLDEDPEPLQEYNDEGEFEEENTHVRMKRRKKKPKKKKKKRKKKKKKKKKKKHGKRFDDNPESDDRLASLENYDTYFVEPSNNYDLIPAFKSRRLKFSSEAIGNDEDADVAAEGDLVQGEVKKHDQQHHVSEDSSVHPFAPVFPYQSQDQIEGEDAEEDEPIAKNDQQKQHNYVITKKEDEDYDDDDDHSKALVPYQQPTERTVNPFGTNQHVKFPKQEQVDEEEIDVSDIKNENRVNAAHGHGRKKKKKHRPKNTNHTVVRDTGINDSDNMNLFLQYNPEFQEWPKFVMNDRDHRELVRKRSLQNKAAPVRHYFPLSSGDFFMVPKSARMVKRVNVKREDSSSEAAAAVAESNAAPAAGAESSVAPGGEASSIAAGEASSIAEGLLGDLSSSEGISIASAAEHSESTTEECSRKGNSASTLVCDEENFNHTEVIITTALPIIKEQKTIEPMPKTNDTKILENFIKLDSIMNGKLPGNILQEIHKKAPSKIKANLRKDDLNMHLNFTAATENQESIKLMQKITLLMSQLQQSTICQSLSGILKRYLKYITQFPQEDVLTKVKIMEEVNVDENQRPYVFQSHQGDNLENKLAIMKDLLDRYSKLPEKCKERAEPVKEYIENHMGMLDNMMTSSNTTMESRKDLNKPSGVGPGNATAKAKKSLESQDRFVREKGSKAVIKDRNSAEQLTSMDLMVQEQLESLGLGSRKSFKPRFDLDQMVELNKLPTRSSGSGSSSTQRSVEKREIGSMGMVGNGKTISKQFEKLQAAVNSLKAKNDRNRRLGKMYGRNSGFDDNRRISKRSNGGGMGFEKPLVVSF